MQSNEQSKVMYQSSTTNDGNPPPYSGPPPPGPYYPPGGYGGPGPYGTGPHMATATIVPAMVPAVIVTQPMGPQPSTTRCRSCQQDIMTRVQINPTLRTHLFAAILCLIGCWPCVCLPYCMDACRNTDHYCPNCGAYIGSYMS